MRKKRYRYKVITHYMDDGTVVIFNPEPIEGDKGRPGWNSTSHDDYEEFTDIFNSLRQALQFINDCKLDNPRFRMKDAI